MWKCEDCGKTFEDPRYYDECVGEYWGAPAYETWAICPYCESTEIEEVNDHDNGDD